jgi:hypothetical protein
LETLVVVASISSIIFVASGATNVRGGSPATAWSSSQPDNDGVLHFVPSSGWNTRDSSFPI